jgi:flagellar basal-body rod protein FlgF
MNYGFYAAFLGMRARQRTLDVIANNIANASTTGFKAERLRYRSVEAAEVARLRAEENGIAPSDSSASASPAASSPTPSAEQIDRAFGVVTGSMKDLSTGATRETGKPLDLAIQGDGYFAVQTPRGERYTRAGSFTLDADGQLVTQRGELVVGERGPVTLPPGEISVGEDGTLSVAGREVDRLKIVRFTNAQTALTREGDTAFATTGAERPAQAVNARVVQGVVESSNVNVVSEMAAMMQNSREFDSLQRSVKLMMDIRRAASEIGKI